MCNACVIDNVKAGMMSRRKFFGSSAAGTAAIALGAAAARPALAASTGRVIDLTHAWDESFPTFDGKPGIEYEQAVNFDESGYQLWKLTIYEHSGTHIDAPLHFSADGKSVDQIEPESLICPICVIDISQKAAEDANASLDPEDIEAWIQAHGDIPAGALVAMHSGWAAKVNLPEFRNDAQGKFAFPGFSKAATDLLAQMGVAGIGVDSLSLDTGAAADFAVHNSWLPDSRFGIECLAGLDQLPPTGATAFIGAPKHKRGTGGPARILAVL